MSPHHRSRSESRFRHMKTSFACAFSSHTDNYEPSASSSPKDERYRGRSAQPTHHLAYSRSYSKNKFTQVDTNDSHSHQIRDHGIRTHADSKQVRFCMEDHRTEHSHCRYHQRSHIRKEYDVEEKSEDIRRKEKKDHDQFLTRSAEEQARKKAKEEKMKMIKQLEELETRKKERQAKHYHDISKIDRSLAECDIELAQLTKLNKMIRTMRSTTKAK